MVFEVFVLGSLAGICFELIVNFFFEVLHGKTLRLHHKFKINQKIGLSLVPVWGIVAVIFYEKHFSHLALFVTSAVIGTFFEFMLGKFIYSMFNIKLWTYRHGKIGEFTSIYSIPYWGAAGLLFVYLARILGV